MSCSIINPLLVEANDNVGGFSTELIHRDSPLLNHNSEHQEVAFKKIGSSGLVYDFGGYLMKIWYGNPPVEFLQLFDTGSNVSWIQCLPCVSCFPSNYREFNPKMSQTFKWKLCDLNKKCRYSVRYGDNSTTRGFLATDTIMVGSDPHRVQFKNFIFGCGHENRGIFSKKSAGIVGFNPSDKSFITQLSSIHRGKFSFCMAEKSSLRPGRISFGDEARVSGRDVMTSPLILDASYKVKLDSITIGTNRIKNLWNHSENANVGGGSNNVRNMMVDSGTTYMYLSHNIYTKVEELVRKQIKIKMVVPSPVQTLKVCYYSKDLKDTEIPKIILHFPGANLELSPLHTFKTAEGFRCLAIVSHESKHILGNMAMTNFLVGLDLVAKKISFKPTNCSTL